ncbi:caspase family protein, partial [Lentimicrobium sp. S6]|uniref:caspase family protein n=1 Tax=Lentimicrobium sp. S6 TaxID=2735872 RepID=UPI0015525E98
MFKFKAIMILLMVLCINHFGISQEKYAVLITGEKASSSSIPMSSQWGTSQTAGLPLPEFWNDTYLMWEMLVYEMGYADENVFVIFADGEDAHINDILPRYIASIRHSTEYNPGDYITDYRATRNNVQNVFNGLANGTSGFPEITEDDFLFVYTFGHGMTDDPTPNTSHMWLYGEVGGPQEKLYSYELAALTDPIPANRKVFWMQQCLAGNFSYDLEAINTVFNSATHHETGSPADNETIGGQSVDEWDYYQTVPNDFAKHGEFNFHMYSSTMGESPTGINNYDGDLYINADLNNDNVISVYEASYWHGIKESAPETQKFVDLGGIGIYTSLKYPTLLWKNAYSNETYRGIIGISKSFSVEPGVELTFFNKSKIEVLNGAELTVKKGATLTIGNNVDITNGKIIIEDGATVNIDTDLYLDK